MDENNFPFSSSAEADCRISVKTTLVRMVESVTTQQKIICAFALRLLVARIVLIVSVNTLILRTRSISMFSCLFTGIAGGGDGGGQGGVGVPM